MIPTKQGFFQWEIDKGEQRRKRVFKRNRLNKSFSVREAFRLRRVNNVCGFANVRLSEVSCPVL